MLDVKKFVKDKFLTYNKYFTNSSLHIFLWMRISSDFKYWSKYFKISDSLLFLLQVVKTSTEMVSNEFKTLSCSASLLQTTAHMNDPYIFDRDKCVFQTVTWDGDTMLWLTSMFIIFQLNSWPSRIIKKFEYRLYNTKYPEPTQEWKLLFKPCASQRLFIPVSWHR